MSDTTQSIIENLGPKLRALSASSQSIETMTLWFFHHARHASQFAVEWDRELRADQKLAFFYLANDVLQRCRKKCPEYSDAFRPLLVAAVTHICREVPDKIVSVTRVLDIWQERAVVGADMLADMRRAARGGSAAGHSSAPVASRPSHASGTGTANYGGGGAAAAPMALNGLSDASSQAAALSMTRELEKALSTLLTLVHEDRPVPMQRDNLFDMEAVWKMTNAAQVARIVEEMDAACNALAKNQGRLAGEAEDRNMVVRLLSALLDRQHAVAKRGKVDLLECDNLFARLGEATARVQTHLREVVGGGAVGAPTANGEPAPKRLAVPLPVPPPAAEPRARKNRPWELVRQ